MLLHMAKAAAIQFVITLRSRTDGAWIAPPKLRQLLVEDAKRDGSNLHDVALAILSDKFGVAFEPSGRTTFPKRDSDTLKLLVSPALWRRLGASGMGSRQRRALEVLAEHYALDMPEPPNRTRVRSAA